MKKIVSIIVPVFNEEKNVLYAYKKIVKIFSQILHYDYEIVFVDNYSQDNSRILIKDIVNNDKKVTALFMSRNFTSEYSSFAAMKQAIGDAIIILDCDLQDPPELIPVFIKEWEKGHDIVLGIRDKINDTFMITFFRKLFYIVFKRLAHIEMPLNAGSFCLLNRRVMNIINSLPEKNRFFRGLRAWVGYKITYVEYERKARKFGKSKNSFFDYIRDAQRGLLGFSFVPLDIITSIGFFLVIASFLFIFSYFITILFFGNPINASIPILLSIFFFGSVQLLAISVVGKYIQIIFEEVKNRPSYIIESILNNHQDKKYSSIYQE